MVFAYALLHVEDRYEQAIAALETVDRIGIGINENTEFILKTAESYTYLTFAHPVLKPLPASGRGLELSPY